MPPQNHGCPVLETASSFQGWERQTLLSAESESGGAYSLSNRLPEPSCEITDSSAVCCVFDKESCVAMLATSACIRVVCAAISWVCSLLTALPAELSCVMELSTVTRCCET